MHTLARLLCYSEKMAEPNGLSFENLTPELILGAVETHTGLFLDGVINPYNSYVNRVFGVTDEDEKDYIVKFYRSGRWSREAIADEFAFLADCASVEIPVVLPIGTIGEAGGFYLAVFPRIRARTFDIITDEDWIRVGSLVGRIHGIAGKNAAPHRLRCNPEETTSRYIANLIDNRLVHPDCLEDFSRICAEALSIVNPLFESLPAKALHRIHGDCHRGNILTGRDNALTIIDFDDMMTGPAIQDLWLLLPGHIGDSMREMNLILEGYGEFSEFDRRTVALVEPLRFMRNIYFLNWCAIQKDDTGFASRFPDWGNRAFWITETEDLSSQLDYLRHTSVYL